MALNHYVVALFCQLRLQAVVGPGCAATVLEFGEQNWFGDVDPREIDGLIGQFEPDADVRGRLSAQLQEILTARRQFVLFELARLFYRVVLGEHQYRAIDLHGTPLAERHNLNEPLPITEQFDLVTNIGTAEHVFNVDQFFRSLHQRTRPGGLMLHVMPNQGCYDHGLFNFHPTFLFDLAGHNGYRIECLLYCDMTTGPGGQWVQLFGRADYVRLAVSGQLSPYSYLMAVLRKAESETPFVPPMQGYYDNRLPAELAEAWARMPR